MAGPIALALTCLVLLMASMSLFYRSWRKSAAERVMVRLAHGQPSVLIERPGWARMELAFLRAGLGRPTDQLTVSLVAWLSMLLLGYWMGTWVGLLLAVVGPPLLLRLYISWRYQRRVRRMIEQLPPLLDHAVRSLKSGRTLADAVLHGIESAANPLQLAMRRIQRSVQLGVSLPDAAQDFADLYEKEEFRLFALGLRVNHRYGGNASELMENLITLIREREQGARQLRAMTGETRMTAWVLALLPLGMVGYFLSVNPNYLMNMWNETSGQHMLLAAFILQVVGCLVLWRMLRSI
ncbi:MULTISPECIES: type II secretion system F family protein [unclassified Pseudomonas]|uniref:type II secretion system F family protein n=1 Tax=unclassified Pseudomonas TaxID=196821 RepID=UPI002AC8987C|nr:MULTISPECIES: type II secretion system F family protein [unclassified Pseudomonas]MEB0041632.1 type II secretion system F family protein [Pseudomonas sp. MH10]MEB0121992.1 type II secretion system F family protein [Pseudomonas sp. CCI1.2]WPX61945.1 type II secretion system F family protein [Pseudomonas sp. MH10]